MKKEETKYEESLFYQLNASTRYFNKLFEQFFKELNSEISGIEHLALSIIKETNNCCQRDLARLMVKDRANTGKIASSLEKRGFIKIKLKEKNNKPVKILTLTKKGEKIQSHLKEKMNPVIKKVYAEFPAQEVENLKQGLIKFKNVVEKAVKINI